MTMRPFKYHVAVVFLDDEDNELTSQPVTVPAKAWDNFVTAELPTLVAQTIEAAKAPPTGEATD